MYNRKHVESPAIWVTYHLHHHHSNWKLIVTVHWKTDGKNGKTTITTKKKNQIRDKIKLINFHAKGKWTEIPFPISYINMRRQFEIKSPKYAKIKWFYINTYIHMYVCNKQNIQCYVLNNIPFLSAKHNIT